ncbi:MAG: trypsin-like peptidase domain-containing protein [Acidobacteriaceae bacterium]
MTQETSKRDSEDRRGVSVAVLLIAMLATAILVAAVFLIQRRHSPASHKAAANSPLAAAVTTTPALRAASKPASIPAAGGSPAPLNLTDEELFRQAAPSVVLLRAYDQSGQPFKLGSGFIAGPSGIAVTNYHVIRGAYSETATFQDGSTARVIGVLGYDPAVDIAVIRLDVASATPLVLGDSDSVQVGDRVAAIGSPLGLQNTISDGLVSALRDGRIQTSTPISPGSSGGPFFNKRGQVIGIAVAQMRAGQNLNFVVPINQARRFLANDALTTLADLSKQNTMVMPLLHGALSIPARQLRGLSITVNENQMDDAELQGSFQCSGGIDGKIQVVLLNVSSRALLYDSGRVRSGTMDVKLPPGKYALVLSNRDSLVFPRAMNADFSLHYVK